LDQDPETDQQATPSRRTVMSVGAVGLASMAGLTACGGSSTGGSGAMPMTGPAMADAQSSVAGSAASGPAGVAKGANAQQAANTVTLDLKTVPKGGFTTAMSPDGKPVIVARTRRGRVVAFSATCTHQGCQVMPAGKKKLDCPCHGAEFDPLTGHVLKGPAKKPLPKIPVKVHGQMITLE
jgi:Rieske Fe-S protein